jgi:beta-glucosidase
MKQRQAGGSTSRRLITRMIATAACTTLLVTATGPAPVAQAAPQPTAQHWWDEDPVAAQRARDLLARMTLEEKVDMMTGELNNYYGFFNAAIPRLGIPALTMADGPTGVRIANPNVNGQRATQFPAADARAATFSADVEEQVGDLQGDEAFNTGHNVMLAPSVDIARHPQAGRLAEAYTEDPLLSGVMGAAYIRGVQGHPVMATIKHFNAYNQETNRFTGNAQVAERALEEIYSRPYDIGIRQGRPGAAMCAFNRVNGVFACENEIMRLILKEQLNFAGFIMSDYGATPSTARAVNAGLDQEQPGGTWFGTRLMEAVRAGQVSEARINDAVLRILRPMFALGLFDRPVQVNPLPEREHGQQSRKIAEQGMVLLKNSRATLPLSANRLRSIAVLGADADAIVAPGGSPLVRPTYEVSPLQAIRDRVGAGVRVEHVRGNDPVNASAILPGIDVLPQSLLTPAGGGAPGTGLRAEYWSNLTFAGAPGLVRTDPYVGQALGFFNFSGFNAQSPHLPVTPGDFNTTLSARWTGTVTAPVTGRYTLTLHSRGLGRVFLDDRLIIDNPSTTTTTATATLGLIAGRSYSLRVEYANTVTGPRAELGPEVKLSWTHPDNAVPPQITAAVNLARRSDVAVVVVRDYGTEGGDRSFLDLPNNQTQLIREVAAVNPRTIVVLTTSGPIQTNTWQQRVPSILQAWYGGQEQGNAIARILFGQVNPSGKLPITFPVDEATTPIDTPEGFPGVNETTVYSEGVFVGYRGYDQFRLPVQYPFGHGLSYTSFAYNGLRVNDSNRTVSFNLRNTGRYPGAEVAQVYVGRLPTRTATPPKQLAGWSRVSLRPGQQQRVTVTLDNQSLSYWDATQDRWITPRGPLPIYVGTSSRQIRLVGLAFIR